MDGNKLIGEAITLMTAAAGAAISPGKVLSARQAAQTREYLQHVKMGQTERGSFVLTIISPLTPLATPEVQTLFDFIDEPFPRKVTKTLTAGLNTVRMAVTSARNSGHFGVFEEVVERGVSANLCEAIAGLLAATGHAGRIGVDVAWAPSFPNPMVDPQPFEFLQEEGSVLMTAARFLRESSPGEGIAIAGVVVRLARDPDADEGIVTVLGIAGGAVRRIWVPLGAADYEIATNAHRDKRGVHFLADIMHTGRKYQATNVAEFRLQE